jgi:hypothetical protein
MQKGKKMNTSIRMKKELWPKFVKACESQFMCGGERYKLGDGGDKEFTDLVCEAVKNGNNWVGQNIIKYCGEIFNSTPKPEVDFFKIAVYAFIWWLKEQENLTSQDKGEEFNTDGKTLVAKEDFRG